MSYEGNPTNRFGEYHLLSPVIFGLKCDEKLEYSLVQFHDMKKVMPVDFGGIKMSSWVRKKAS